MSAVAADIDQLFKGFGFGFMLQLAIGPVCLYILTAANRHGFLAAESAVLGVALVDGLYILAALWGVGRLLQTPRTQRLVHFTGQAVLVAFGLLMIHAALFGQPVATAAAPAVSTALALLTGAIVLTAASPLTILFWTGVFSARMSADALSRRQAVVFGAGCLLSTIVFLSAIAALGQLIHTLLVPALIRLLNGLIGAALVAIGLVKALRAGRPRS